MEKLHCTVPAEVQMSLPLHTSFRPSMGVMGEKAGSAELCALQLPGSSELSRPRLLTLLSSHALHCMLTADGALQSMLHVTQNLPGKPSRNALRIYNRMSHVAMMTSAAAGLRTDWHSVVLIRSFT